MVMLVLCSVFLVVFFFKQKAAYEMRISDWSSDVCSSDLNRSNDDESCISVPGSASSGPAFLADCLAAGSSSSGHRGAFCLRDEIGRASCRERVCQDV